jgi:putative heme iron utilization protein
MTHEGAEARHYLRRQRYGVLSTLSKKLGGYPFGSMVPFMLRFDFEQPATDAADARRALVSMAHEARAR